MSEYIVSTGDTEFVISGPHVGVRENQDSTKPRIGDCLEAHSVAKPVADQLTKEDFICRPATTVAESDRYLELFGVFPPSATGL